MTSAETINFCFRRPFSGTFIAACTGPTKPQLETTAVQRLTFLEMGLLKIHPTQIPHTPRDTHTCMCTLTPTFVRLVIDLYVKLIIDFCVRPMIGGTGEVKHILTIG